MAKRRRHAKFYAPPTSGLAARGREISKFGATWRGQLASAFAHIKILSCDSQGVSARQIIGPAHFRFGRQRAGKFKLRRNLAGPFVTRLRSYCKLNLRWPRGINLPNCRPRPLPIWPLEGQKVQTSVPPGGANWHPFSHRWQT